MLAPQQEAAHRLGKCARQQEGAADGGGVAPTNLMSRLNLAADEDEDRDEDDDDDGDGDDGDVATMQRILNLAHEAEEMILGSVTQTADCESLPLLEPREHGTLWKEEEYGGRGFRVDLSTSHMRWCVGCKDVEIVKRSVEAAASDAENRAGAAQSHSGPKSAPNSVATFLWEGVTKSGKRVLPWCYWKFGPMNEDNETLAQCVVNHGVRIDWIHTTMLAKCIFLDKNADIKKSFTFAVVDMSKGTEPLFIKRHEQAMELNLEVTRIFRTAIPTRECVADAINGYELAVARDRCASNDKVDGNAASSRALGWWELPDTLSSSSRSTRA